MVAITYASLAVELTQMVALIGPERAYGALNGGGVKVAARISLGRLSFSPIEPEPRPAVHCVVDREQVPLSGIQGRVTGESPASTAGASDPEYSEVPLPGSLAPAVDAGDSTVTLPW